MVLKKSIRENNYIGVQMNQYPQILEELIYAFQDERVVNLIKDVCEISDLQPDENLYAGGIVFYETLSVLKPTFRQLS